MYQPPSPSTHEYPNRSKSKETVPLGIYIIAIVGGIGSFLAFVPILNLMRQGSGFILFGLVLFVFGVAQFYILVGLVNLKPWAWKGAFVSYACSALVYHILDNRVSVIVALIALIYLSSTVEYYRK